MLDMGRLHGTLGPGSMVHGIPGLVPAHCWAEPVPRVSGCMAPGCLKACVNSLVSQNLGWLAKVSQSGVGLW